MVIGRRPVRALVVLLVLLAGVPAVRADVPEYLGRPVTGVRLAFEGHTEQDARLRELVVTAVGAPLSMADVRETITHLMSLGRFQDVRVHAARQGDGVLLTYELIPLQRVGQLRFEGQLGLPTRELRTAVTDRYGVSPPLGRVDEVVRLLRGLYEDHGYLRPTIAPETDPQPDRELVTLVFRIDAGPRARIEAIRLAGSPLRTRAEILDHLALKVGDPYDRVDLRARLDRYTEELKTAGYYEARIDPSIVPGEHDATVALTLTIEPGPHVTIAFEGDPLPPDEQTELVPIRREGSVDEDLLEDSGRRIQDYFRAQGYRDATASFSREQHGNELAVVFRIHRGPLYRVAAVVSTGDTAVHLADLPADLQLRPGQPFVQSRLDAAVAALELRYRQLGYSAARVTSAVTPARGAGDPVPGVAPVDVGVTVVPGVRTIIDDVQLVGNASVSGAVLRDDLRAIPGRPFYDPDIARDRDVIQTAYQDRGYQSASVTPQLGFSADRSRVAIRYLISEGPQIFIEHILVVGNTRTSTKLIERELGLKPGEPLNLQALSDGQRRLVALGLFRRVRISQLLHGSDTRRDVLVTVEEAPTTTIGYGGGLEVGVRPRANGQTGFAVDQLEFAPRALFEITRRNLFGKNRSVSLFSRVSFRPNAAPFVAGGTSTDGGYGFSDYRVIATYREPRLFGTAADALLTGVIEQGVRTSFNFAHRGFSAQVARRLSPALSISGNYAIDRNRQFDVQVSPADQLLVDRLFPQVRLSSFSGSIVDDTRDDPLDPTRGELLVVNGQLAGRAIGSEVGFAKTFLQGAVYRTLPGTRHLVFASDVRLGLASGFPRVVPATDAQGQPIPGPGGQMLTTTVRDLPISERFFAGGPTTVRGFALDQLGTPATIDANGFPIGGDALVILNAELRAPLWRSIGIVGFLDAGNVFAHVMDINPSEIRAAAGFGFRYKSPIGPLRIDLGFKLARHLLASGAREQLMVLNISLGEAF
ncbi:MAG: BamA/TamA family outer membrane protein [Acidobacteriota bacterium]|nr:BamA/TamA family outer membrane protein [Acidobacteriota bacterium]